MRAKNKIKLANLTIWIMVVTISIITIWFIGYMVTNTFDLNVFTKQTSSFMWGFVGFSAVLVLCSAILNISLNIGLIADSKIEAIKSEGSNTINKKIYVAILLGITALITFLFLGDYLSRKNEENKLTRAASYIIETYSESINKIPSALIDTSQIEVIPEILNFLSNQKSEFPSITLITSGEYDGQLTFLEIKHNKYKLKDPLFGNSFYQCEDYDCSYLKDFFEGNTNESLFWTQKNDYRLYYPFTEKDVQYILLFTKHQRYGKVSSF